MWFYDVLLRFPMDFDPNNLDFNGYRQFFVHSRDKLNALYQVLCSFFSTSRAVLPLMIQEYVACLNQE